MHALWGGKRVIFQKYIEVVCCYKYEMQILTLKLKQMNINIPLQIKNLLNPDRSINYFWKKKNLHCDSLETL